MSKALVLFPELNETIVKTIKRLKIQYEVSDHAPSTFEELSRNIGTLKVWAGESNHTIYGDAQINYAFRAWHDYTHLKLNSPFTLDGELTVAKHQASLVGDTLGAVIMAEVYGQALLAIKTGQFPANQIEFILNYLKVNK